MTILDSVETSPELTQEVSLAEQQARNMVISNDSDYADAGDLTRAVKQMQKKVKDYWEPMRVSAKTAYDNVLNHKKAMLTPLENAEKTLKDKMADYTMEKERRRLIEERVMRELAEQERLKKLAEADVAEAAGDAAGAAYARAEAEVMEGAALTGHMQSSTPKADGVSQSKAWRIVSIDSEKVPVTVCGTVIRPVDEKAVMRLIRESKGMVRIPGVEYEETVSIRVRAKA